MDDATATAEDDPSDAPCAVDPETVIPTSLSVGCPVCECSIQIEFDEIDELDCGGWGIAPKDRFQHCPECGAFVDLGGK